MKELSCFVTEDKNLSPDDSTALVVIDGGQTVIKFILTVKRKERIITERESCDV